MANSQRDPKRKPFEPGDFFPEIAPEPMPLKQKLRATFEALRMRARKR